MTEEPAEHDNEQSILEQQVETEKRRSEGYLNRLRYLQADFDNLKKRCDRQVEEAKNYSNERIILRLLDVVDELELAVKTGEPNRPETQPLLTGIQMTLKKLRKVLEQEGVSLIECEGQVFDPTKHSAVAKAEREGIKGCIVGEEIRRGYIMKDKVIRPSIVKVEVSPSQPSKSPEENQKEKKENE
ncbi:MAG TPA: nucleotide exchange factor GrpE [Candidatus Bathyarchaeia archaeon]